MLSNAQIKTREIYKVKQELIKARTRFRDAQQDLLLALNECALSEYRNDNKLKKGVVTIKCKSAIKEYFVAYGKKLGLEEHLQSLYDWKAED